MNGDEEAVDVEETLARLMTEVDHLREHLTYVSQTVRRLVEVIIREDDDSAVH